MRFLSTLIRPLVVSCLLFGANHAGSEVVPELGSVEAGSQVHVDAKRITRTAAPFWRLRPALMDRIRDERAIIVSVKREDIPSDQVRFTMSGAGWVSRPKDFCFQVSQMYPRLKDISENFRTVEFDPKTNQLYLVTEALGYQARMVLRVLPVSEEWRSELQWEVVWGHFKGMTGLIGFEKVAGGEKTEMSVNAKYEAAELPLPRILMGFALEVVMQKVAEKMRAFIEAQPAYAAEPAVPSAISKQDLLDQPNLNKIKLPPGFSISLFAKDVPNARQMTLSPAGTLYVGTRESGSKGDVYALPGAAAAAAKGERAPPARVIATGLRQPNGVAFHGKDLYVAEISRVVRFPDIEKNLDKKNKAVVVRDDYPTREHHGWKYIAFGPDGWLYVPVGAPCNVCKEQDPLFASLTRISLDGKKRELFATGIRNTVGFDWDPRTKQIWFTDNGRDLLGDDIPSDELNHAPRAGLDFGFPYCHQGDMPDPEFGKDVKCGPDGKFVQPAAKLGAHVAALGMKFYTGSVFPQTYRHRVFIAEHGSWNRTQKSGYRVVSVPIDDTGKAGEAEVFAEGWLNGQSAWGRPVDILQMPDGSLLVSDDEAGAIYRIAYSAK